MRVPLGDTVEALGDLIADVRVVELKGGIVVAIPRDVETALKLQAVCQAMDETFGRRSPLPLVLVAVTGAEHAGKFVRALLAHFDVVTNIATPSVARDIVQHNAANLVVSTEDHVRPLGARPAPGFDPKRN